MYSDWSLLLLGGCKGTNDLKVEHPVCSIREAYLAFSGPKLEVETKMGKLSIINHVMTTLGQLLQLFGFLVWLLKIVD